MSESPERSLDRETPRRLTADEDAHAYEIIKSLRTELSSARARITELETHEKDSERLDWIDSLLANRDSVQIAWSIVTRDVSFVAVDFEGGGMESGTGPKTREAIDAARTDSKTEESET